MSFGLARTLDCVRVSAILVLLFYHFYFVVQMLLDPQRNLEVEEEVGAASNLASASPAFLPASDFRPGIHASRVFDIKVKQLETTRGLPSRLIVDQTSR